MYLYLVTCVCRNMYDNQTLDVYVVANDPSSAEEKALKLMNSLSYKYDSGVNNVKLIASVNTNKADYLLAI